MNSKRRIRFQNGELIFGSLLIFGFLVVAIAAPMIAPPAGDFPDLPYIIPRDGFKGTPLPPNPDHPFGTLPDQYDVLYGLVWGTRRAFLVGISITLGRTLIGVILGLISGYYKGILSNLIMRVTDAFMSMPSIAAAALMFALFGEVAVPSFLPGGGVSDPTAAFLNENRNALIIMLSLILFGWMQYARLVRANVISEREKEYVQAAKSIGASNGRIMVKHIFPNMTKGLYVLVASDIGGMVAIVSLFYFIGLIGNSPYGLIADWGQILSVSRDWIVGPPSTPFLYWYTYFPAIAAIALFTIGWSMIGDGLRDLLDPRRSLRARKKAEAKKSIFTQWFERLAGARPQSPVLRSERRSIFERPLESEPDSILAFARNALEQGDLTGALDAYSRLIWDGKHIETIVQDLQIAVSRHPDFPLTWHILGDALMQAGQHEKAQRAFAHSLQATKNGKVVHPGTPFFGNISAAWNKSLTGKLMLAGLPVLAFALVYLAFRLYAGTQGQPNTPASNPEMTMETPVSFLPVEATITPLPAPSRTAAVPRESSPTPTGPTDTPTPDVQPPASTTACIPDNPSQTGWVVEIIDGNTIKILIDEYVYVVRYIGIDVPAYGEENEPYGPEAAFENADLVYQKEVTLIPDFSDKDPRGRLLRYVLVGDVFVNYELLAQGFATALDAAPNSACADLFQQAEQLAIENQVGRWVSVSATPGP